MEDYLIHPNPGPEEVSVPHAASVVDAKMFSVVYTKHYDVGRDYWHCYTERGLCICRASVCQSVRLSVPARAHSRKPAAAGLLLWSDCAGQLQGNDSSCGRE